MAEKDHQLSSADIDHFIQHGWVKISNCFTREQAADEIADLWERLGMDPNDNSTWHTEWVTTVHTRAVQLSNFSPKAWGGVCSLVGDPSKIDPNRSAWRDRFIVNLGTPKGHNNPIKPQDLKGWHVDGDSFVHYLDSPEQALLIIPLWSDIPSGGGGTVLCPRGIDVIAKFLYEHPEGVSPMMNTRAENPEFREGPDPCQWFNKLAASMPDDAFVEATGVVGDVYFLHPLMLHSAANNHKRTIRVISNPPTTRTEPYILDREDGDYVPVERTILRALGKDRLEGWKIQAPRQWIIPERERREMALRKAEEERLAKLRDIAQEA